MVDKGGGPLRKIVCEFFAKTSMDGTGGTRFYSDWSGRRFIFSSFPRLDEMMTGVIGENDRCVLLPQNTFFPTMTNNRSGERSVRVIFFACNRI